MNGKIAYRFNKPGNENTIYINLIARYSCINDCLFCGKPDSVGEVNIYENNVDGVGSLYLKKSPSIDLIMDEIGKEFKDDDDEITIVGLGEPLIYFKKIPELLRRIKEKYDITTRLDTNGIVNDKDYAYDLKEAGLDKIFISVNAVNKREYDVLCRPRVDDAYEKMLNFTRECIKAGIDTYASFVVGFPTVDEKTGEPVKTRDSKDYEEFAKSIGIRKDHVVLRNYVDPSQPGDIEPG